MGIREAQAQVELFFRAVGQEVGDQRDPQFRDVELRTKLIAEEFIELMLAIVAGDMVKAADNVIDTIFVLIGAGVSWGLDLEPLWQEVTRANMLKVGGPIRSDGKRGKPPGWQEPAIAALLEAQKERGR